MGPQLIQWYFCQLVIKYAIRRDTPCSKADTLLRLRGARSRLRTGGIPFSVLIITKLAGVGKLFLEDTPFLRYILITKTAGLAERSYTLINTVLVC